MVWTTVYQSPIGGLTLAGDGEHLTGLWVEGQKYFMAGLTEPAARKDDNPVFEQARQWLDRYFAGERPVPEELPLQPHGTAFQRAVWDCLCKIPWGQVTTYGAISREIARQLGRASLSAQAVGGAVGHNPISIIIPCHRVVGADGSLTGYAGGVDRKLWLLQREGVDASRLRRPRRGSAL